MSQNNFFSHSWTSKKTVYAIVRVDGGSGRKPSTISIKDGPICANKTVDDEIIDCAGEVLLPGLIDFYVNLLHSGHLEQLCQAGQTLSEAAVGQMADEKRVAIPTVTMVQYEIHSARSSFWLLFKTSTDQRSRFCQWWKTAVSNGLLKGTRFGCGHVSGWRDYPCLDGR